MSNIKFVNLHGHSTFSTFDGYGYPDVHIDTAIEKGMMALALTDHGTMNGLSYQVLHSKKLAKANIEFKPIYGVEAYYIDSLEEWESQIENKNDKSEKINEEDRKKNKSKYAHIVLLAQNEQGYKNLCKIVSASHGKYFYRKPRVDYDLLKKNSEGIIGLSACLSGVYAKMMWNFLEEIEGGIKDTDFINQLIEKTKKMQEIFGVNWYAELQWNAIPEQHLLNKFLINLHKKCGIKLVSTCDAHYPKREDWNAREVYKKLGWLGSTDLTSEWIQELSIDKDKLECELYIKNGDELFSEYKRYTALNGIEYDDELILESIERSYQIADSIEAFYPNSEAKFPKFLLENINPQKELRDLTQIGLQTIEKADDSIYKERLQLELDIISSRGFCEYFLIMKKISDFTKKRYITGPGRGSAAGALVTYLLGITQIDPIKNGLLFSRFMRKDSEGFPDIDYDVPERDKLILQLTQHWGENSVIQITNWNTLSMKSCTKDLAKLLGVDFQEVNEVTRIMDSEAIGPAKEAAGIKSGVYSPTLDEYIKFSPTFSEFLEKYPEIEQYLRLLEGQIRSQSRHAGGVLICENLNEKMPLIRGKALSKEAKQIRTDFGLSPYMYQTPWTEGQKVRHLEPFGFIKFDILAIEVLSIIEKTIELILYRKNNKAPTFGEVKKYYENYLHPDHIDENNPEVMKSIFHEGRWAGIFQFAEEGAQGFCQRVKPESVLDLSIITSIYRPGPLGAGVHEKYLKAKEDPSGVIYEHPIIKEVTEETYGFLIFQEQIAMLAHKLGKNLSLDEGDLLRKVLTKKGTGKDEVKDKLKEKFLAGCCEKSLSLKKAEEIWAKFELFAGYGFNKSHAFCYSFISYICAWLLHYHPDEWLASYLDTQTDKKREEAITAVRFLGYLVKDIDINISDIRWMPTYSKELVQPLNSLKGIGDKALTELLKCRPFNSIEELIFHPKMDYRKINKKILGVLVQSGALNTISSEFKNLKHLCTTIANGRVISHKQYKEKFELNKDIEDYTDEEKIFFKTELCGLYPFRDIVSEEILRKLTKSKCIPIGQYCGDGIAWGVIKSIEYKKTSKSKDYAVITLIDSSYNEIGVKCWAWRFDNKPVLNGLYLLKLDYNDKWGLSSKNFINNFKLVLKEELC